MPFAAEDKVTIRLLKEELEGWRPFLEALRFEDRQVAREMMESCWRYVEAVEQSGKEFLTEPFFLTVLLAQEKRLKEFEAEFERLKGEVAAWKSRAGSHSPHHCAVDWISPRAPALQHGLLLAHRLRCGSATGKERNQKVKALRVHCASAEIGS